MSTLDVNSPLDVTSASFLRAKLRMHLINLISIAKFYRWSIDPNTNVVTTLETMEYEIRPVSTVLDEVDSDFIDGKSGRYLATDRSALAWKITLTMPTNAIFERFEQLLQNRTATRLPASGKEPQCIISLARSDYEHPTTGGTSNGSIGHFTLSIVPAR